MKTMLLTIMMLMGFAIHQSNAQVASCQPCPPGCCITKGCTFEDCAKMGCDISKCNTTDAKASLTAGKDSKMCCATEAKASTTASTGKKKCCAAGANNTASALNFLNLNAPTQNTKTTNTAVASLPVQEGME